MDQLPDILDWARVPAFLAVAETGSLSAAARRLGQSQPTLGRQIRSLEEQLGVTLFLRQARGLVLTETGAELLGPARAMQAEANRLALAAAGHQETLSGTVRITASKVVSHYLLPQHVAEIRAREPEIQIELAPSDESQNLLFREADIAVRMYRPEQLDMIARHVGAFPLGAFCTRGYAARHGMPTTILEAFARDMIGYDRDDRIIRGLREIGVQVTRADFAVRCDDQVVALELMRAGCGIGFAPASICKDDPDLLQVLPDEPMPSLPVWLTTHEAMRRTPRVRRVWDLLGELLPRVLDPPANVSGGRRDTAALPG